MTEYVDLIYPGLMLTVDLTNSESQGLINPQETTGDALLETEHALFTQKMHLLDECGFPLVVRSRPIAYRYRRTDDKDNS